MAKNVGFNYKPRGIDNVKSLSAPTLIANGNGTYGQNAIADIRNRSNDAIANYKAYRNSSTQNLAADVVGKSGGTVSLDQYGIPQQTLTDFHNLFTNQINAISDRGKSATDTILAKVEWQKAKQLQDLQAGLASQYQNTWTADANSLPAGASANNKGAQAVQLAMRAYRNGTPYVWGGNSLKSGIDCSGLVQQVYKSLGISLPRSSYEQAKAGRAVNLRNLLPGDLVFYNNSNDPNGIGTNAHVAIYMGNGQIIEAASSKIGMRIRGIGNAVGAIRPY